MAATAISIAGMAFDASLSDMTAMSGGHSFDVGTAGGDFLFFNNGVYWGDTTSATPTDKETIVQKRSGGRRIQITRYTDVGGDPLPAISATGTLSPTFTYDSYDDLNNTLPDAVDADGSFINGLAFTLSSNRLNGGVYYTFDVTTGTNTFWWLGYTRNGVWSATVSLSDGSATPVSYNLPTGAANTDVPGYFAATWRGTATQVRNGVTCKIKINRNAIGAGSSGSVRVRGQILRTPVPSPVPGGIPAGKR